MEKAAITTVETDKAMGTPGQLDGLLDGVLETTARERLSRINPIEFANTMGESFARCGWFGAKNADEGKIIALTCQLEGLTPLEFHRMYHIIQGRPSMRSDFMLSEFRRRGGKHKVVTRTPDGASVELTDPNGEKETFTLTWEDAQKEDFVQAKEGKGTDGIKDNYVYPRKRMQMLWARVISDGVRTMTPEIVSGLYTPEEVGDFTESNAEPAPAPSPPTEDVSMVEDVEPSEEPAELDSPASMQMILAAKIDSLFKELDCPAKDKAAALQKRGVTDAAQLDTDEAENLIAILETKVAQAKN